MPSVRAISCFLTAALAITPSKAFAIEVEERAADWASGFATRVAAFSERLQLIAEAAPGALPKTVSVLVDVLSGAGSARPAWLVLALGLLAFSVMAGLFALERR